jgi:hypothetical protein
MQPASKPVDLDARWLYRQSFLLFFLVEPSAVLGWFYPPDGRDEMAVAAASTGRSAGVFDE